MKKRIGRYTIIVIQILIIVVLVYQFEQIDKKGTQIKLETKIDFLSNNEFNKHTDISVEYDINKVSYDAWKITDEINYNAQVYVTLTKSKNGSYKVKEVTKEKGKQVEENDVTLRAAFAYKDEVDDYYYVYYGFEYLEAIERFGQFKQGDHLIVTISLGKLGQQKLTNIEVK